MKKEAVIDEQHTVRVSIPAKIGANKTSVNTTESIALKCAVALVKRGSNEPGFVDNRGVLMQYNADTDGVPSRRKLEK